MPQFSGTDQQFLTSVLGRVLRPTALSAGSPITYSDRAITSPELCWLIGHGNSLTVGSGATTPATQNWLAQADVLLTASQASHPGDVWRTVNRGVGSTGTPTFISNFQAQVHAFYNPSARRNIVAFLEVINDIRHNNCTDQQALDNVLLYVEQARDFGWDVLLFSVPPTGPADTLDDGLQGVTTGPALVNTYLRANIASLSPFPLIDIAVSGKLDTPTDTALWNADQVHPNENGYAIMAADVHAAMLQIAGS